MPRIKNEQNCSLDSKARSALRQSMEAMTDIAQSSLEKRPAWNLIADRNVFPLERRTFI
jgi:hypothetical protein